MAAKSTTKRPAPWKRGRFKQSLKDGGTRVVLGYIKGPFGISPDATFSEMTGERYRVTHIASGLGVYGAGSLAESKAFADGFVERFSPDVLDRDAAKKPRRGDKATLDAIAKYCRATRDAWRPK